MIAPELPFPIIYKEIEGAEQVFEMNGYRLKAFRVNHNVLCYGYTLEIDRAGKFDPERAREEGIPQMYWKHLQKGETVEYEGQTLTPDLVLGPPRKGLKLTYTTDTRPTNSIRENAKNSDLFICEGMYGEKEKAAKAVEYKHMTFYEAAQLAKDAEVGELWLTHYSPSMPYAEEYMDEVRKIFPVEYKHMTFYEAAQLAKDAEVGELWLTHYSPSMPYAEEYMDEVRKIFPGAKAGKDKMSTELKFE